MKCQSRKAARVILIITKGQQREINAQQSLIPKTTVHLPPRTNCQITQPLQGKSFVIEEEVLDLQLGRVIQKKVGMESRRYFKKKRQYLFLKTFELFEIPAKT